MKNFLAWVWEGKFLYLFIILVTSIFQLDNINIGFKPVDNVRFWGLILQLIGTLTIVYSLKDRLILFKGQGLLKFFGDYFKNVPIRKKNRKVSINATSFSSSFATAKARIRKDINSISEIEDIINYFNEEVKYLHERVHETNLQLNSKVADLNTSITSLKNDFSTQITQTKQLLSDSAISNIWLESFGIACIFVGLILGTIPDIVVKFI